MNADKDELVAFKREINLTELMASFGYRLDRKSSSRNSASMKHPDGDKLIVSRTSEGRWVYFSVRDPNDNGTVVDFLGRRTAENLGQIALPPSQRACEASLCRIECSLPRCVRTAQ